LRVVDLGRIDYPSAVEKMSTVLQARIAGEIPDTLLICEHEPVYTVGRTRGAAANILNPEGIPIIEVARGGDVTFHGPGQVVGYPIFQLPPHRHDLHGFMRGLEEMMIRTLHRLGVSGERDPRNTGVWVDGAKVMAIGIGAKRWVTWHGFALNLSTDLSYFQHINPCGMSSTLVTRLADHLKPVPSREMLISLITEELMDWWGDWTTPPG
jgi:lipoyl(octanoyl) transferase